MQAFARRNAVRLSHERFKADAAGITNGLKKASAEAEEHRATKEAEAARLRADEERKAEAEREAKENEKNTARREAAVAGLSAEQIAKAEELANWDFIKDSKNPQEFRDHLARFPRGITYRMARAKLQCVVSDELGRSAER